MPSLTTAYSAKSSQTSNEAMESNADISPINQAVQIVEKKIRNLEKRKSKLDGYRAEYRRGKELNDDQKAAIAKYDEVIQTLDLAKDLTSQFKTLAIAEEKAKKKQTKKESQERHKSELKKIASVLEIQDLLRSLSTSKVRKDFLEGTNGAVKITSDQMACLEKMSSLVLQPTRVSGEDKSAFERAADHLSSLVGGEMKKFNEQGLTYRDLKDLISQIKTCGYFSGDAIADGEDVDDEVPSTPEAEEVEDQKSVNGTTQYSSSVGSDFPQQQPRPEHPLGTAEPIHQQAQPHPQSMQQPVPSAQPSHPIPHSHPQSHSHSHPSSAQPAEGALNFLQDSEIDMESPHMDPAVVLVRHGPPKPPMPHVQHPHSVSNEPPAVNSSHSLETFNTQVYHPSDRTLTGNMTDVVQPGRPEEVKDIQQFEDERLDQDTFANISEWKEPDGDDERRPPRDGRGGMRRGGGFRGGGRGRGGFNRDGGNFRGGDRRRGFGDNGRGRGFGRGGRGGGGYGQDRRGGPRGGGQDFRGGRGGERRAPAE